jgi:histidinol dehydrogenase
MPTELFGMELIQADPALSAEAKLLAYDAVAIDVEGGPAEVLADKDLDAYGDDLVERIVQRLIANGAAEADARAGTYAHWMF